ncbi:hypothetical protein MBOL_38850 [Mycobacteroides abscessus subsp. bolletii BD]|uniref:Uncharacterized protein n=1 Tax=Mycobacteroides abscessus 21 TaxID=1299324 RepID=A0A829PX64_9MYCO|nr:hypothetical protein MMAS_39460 [Mycobacteroides abscessus subsp. massiliense CCUG 48898 = JCM 15300]EHM17299.1 hypothetical protein MBOL_38850 [Mycobacteroides abscessus subsp. bolletii BD]EIU53670.1 hypothetical protein MA6G0728S_3897 [Mycobacteroides abscessus 6G-0728-S]ETZ74688.1 hypothetical protein L835_1775 [Mycobacteroides abscessus MAB_110811_1470]ETZ94573.1 hypothetical protein L828_1831 [Mycobacteroides abscessus MAB_030201_1061]EUA44985.1 hypothetical protein I543_4343 [Mycobact
MAPAPSRADGPFIDVIAYPFPSAHVVPPIFPIGGTDTHVLEGE